MRVQDLSYEEKTELKERYYTEHNDIVSYGELADINELVTDKEIYEEYNGIDFITEDFFCNLDRTNNYEYDYDIREDLEDTINEEDFYYQDFVDSFSDLQILRLATELLKNARDRLDSNLYNLEIRNEYTRLYNITNELNDIIQNYK